MCSSACAQLIECKLTSEKVARKLSLSLSLSPLTFPFCCMVYALLFVLSFIVHILQTTVHRQHFLLLRQRKLKEYTVKWEKKNGEKAILRIENWTSKRFWAENYRETDRFCCDRKRAKYGRRQRRRRSEVSGRVDIPEKNSHNLTPFPLWFNRLVIGSILGTSNAYTILALVLPSYFRSPFHHCLLLRSFQKQSKVARQWAKHRFTVSHCSPSVLFLFCSFYIKFFDTFPNCFCCRRRIINCHSIDF